MKKIFALSLAAAVGLSPVMATAAVNTKQATEQQKAPEKSSEKMKELSDFSKYSAKNQKANFNIWCWAFGACGYVLGGDGNDSGSSRR